MHVSLQGQARVEVGRSWKTYRVEDGKVQLMSLLGHHNMMQERKAQRGGKMQPSVPQILYGPDKFPEVKHETLAPCSLQT